MTDDQHERVMKATEEVFKSSGAGGEDEMDVAEMTVEQPTDPYQARMNGLALSRRQKTARGTSPMVMFAVNAVIDPLADRYKAYKSTYDYLASKDKIKAEQYRQQYLMEDYLPAIEAVVAQASPDEVLNCKEALRVLDEYSGVPGGSGGFVEAYIRQAYGNMLGEVELGDEDAVAMAVLEIKGLASNGRNREAYAKAKQIKDQIDNGELMASEMSYELIARVANA